METNQQAQANPFFRRNFIGGSDARIIMGNDDARLTRLWREKRGEIEPEDLSQDLVVQLGTITEELNRTWYERNTGNAVDDVQRKLRHPIRKWMAATLDGRVRQTGAVFEAKFMLPWNFSEEGAAVTHMLCCSCAICFSAAPSSEKFQGSMNLASNTAPVCRTRPSRVAPIHL